MSSDDSGGQPDRTEDWKAGIDPRRPIAAQVHARLKQAILTLDLAPDESLSEKELSLKFGVSRTPVREAFIKLADEGLVDILPQRGTYVAPIRLRDVLEAQFIRETLEVAVVRQVTTKADDEVLARLDEAIARQGRAINAGRLDSFMVLDDEFHHMFSDIADLPRGWKVIQSVKSQLDRVRYLSLPGENHAELLYRQHREIVEAIRSGDPEKAATSMQSHLRLVFGSIDELVASKGHMFTRD